MSRISVEHLGFAYDGGEPLFDDLSFVLSSTWTGVVGANGCGKSTLLRLLDRSLTPTSGRIRSEGPVVRCRQTSFELDDAVQAFAGLWDKAALRLRDRLKLEDGDVHRWAELSGGQRRRWQVAAALHQRPAVLLLDEPSNHLDTVAREIVVEALRGFRGVGVMVSHDRQLLMQLCTHTLRVGPQGVTLYSSSYNQARRQWTDDEQAARQRHQGEREEQRKLRQKLTAQREEHAQAQKQKSSRSRMKGVKDSDARGASAKSRVAKAEALAGRRVALSRARLERTVRAAQGPVVGKQRGAALLSQHATAPQDRVVDLVVPQLSIAGVCLAEEVSLSWRRRDRVWLQGPNGAGKTTLLKALMDAAGAGADKLAYVAQEAAAGPEAQLGQEPQLGPEQRQVVFQTAAALGLDPSELRTSAGQARKWELASALARAAWGLLLDEPTQHLDLPSVERLQDVLREYPGALILVSHDEEFARSVCDTSWRFCAGRIEVEPLSAVSLPDARV